MIHTSVAATFFETFSPLISSHRLTSFVGLNISWNCNFPKDTNSKDFEYLSHHYFLLLPGKRHLKQTNEQTRITGKKGDPIDKLEHTSFTTKEIIKSCFVRHSTVRLSKKSCIHIWDSSPCYTYSIRNHCYLQHATKCQSSAQSHNKQTCSSIQD